MAETYTVLVAVEDLATASIVAVEAARVAMEHDATRLVLLHVLDQHPVISAIIGMSGYCAPVRETPEEAGQVFAVAEGALCAEFAAMGRALPEVRREIVEGDVAPAIEGAARTHGADVIVLGARRPHAFGRLVHPDVRAHVASRAPCRIHVAALQETPTQAQP